jgi:hypothetical protein
MWSSRISVQKAFDADPQHAFHTIESVLTDAQAQQVEALLCPPMPDTALAEKLVVAEQILLSSGRDDVGDLLTLVQEKLSSIQQ